ncbi:MAG: ornithine--oxo-acid transaminase [Planctomycetes bacterium]|nr:ornithine--oxo-acid transaminase [Planctomycetota bacterium]
MTQLQEHSTTSQNLGSDQHMDMVARFSANNYEPLPVVIARGEGSWVWDVEGNKYLDCLSAYSALNFGHSHPAILDAFIEQARKLTLTSRAFQNDQFGPFCEELTQFCEMDLVLPMNTGAEAVETAIKTARKWGYKVKGVEDNKAQIICCTGNFHGRTTTIVGFSDDPQTKDGFGPFTPGFPLVEYGSIDALKAAITPNTVAFLFEPIQGEGGVVVPPDGFLKEVRELCTQHNILMIADEVQTGLARTGRRFAVDHENVKPDLVILGKALGGGVMPVSAVVGCKEALGVFNPGDHGSTFGGNPLGCAVARQALRILKEDDLASQSDKKGQDFRDRLRAANCSKIKEVRGKGLLIGIEMTPEAGAAKPWCKKLMGEGVLCKDTVESVMRIAPPLNISQADLDWALERVIKILS